MFGNPFSWLPVLFQLHQETPPCKKHSTLVISTPPIYPHVPNADPVSSWPQKGVHFYFQVLRRTELANIKHLLRDGYRSGSPQAKIAKPRIRCSSFSPAVSSMDCRGAQKGELVLPFRLISLPASMQELLVHCQRTGKSPALRLKWKLPGHCKWNQVFQKGCRSVHVVAG